MRLAFSSLDCFGKGSIKNPIDIILKSGTSFGIGGKLYFILTRYILLRGVVLLLLFGAPLYFNTKFYSVADPMLEMIGGVLPVMMLLPGHIEWRYYAQDFEILTINNAVEQARLNAARHN